MKKEIYEKIQRNLWESGFTGVRTSIQDFEDDGMDSEGINILRAINDNFDWDTTNEIGRWIMKYSHLPIIDMAENISEEITNDYNVVWEGNITQKLKKLKSVIRSVNTNFASALSEAIDEAGRLIGLF